MNKKYLITLVLLATLATVSPILAQQQPQPTPEEKRDARIQALMDQVPADALAALSAALDVIQVELTAKGSTMKARKVVYTALADVWKVKALMQQRDQMIATDIAADGDPLIETIEDKIIAIDATKATTLGR